MRNRTFYENGVFFNFVESKLDCLNSKYIRDILNFKNFRGAFIGNYNEFFSFNVNDGVHLKIRGVSKALNLIKMLRKLWKTNSNFFRSIHFFYDSLLNKVKFVGDIGDDYCVEIKCYGNKLSIFLFFNENVIIDMMLMKVLCFNVDEYLKFKNYLNNFIEILYCHSFDNVDNIFSVLEYTGSVGISCYDDAMGGLCNRVDIDYDSIDLNHLGFLILDNSLEHWWLGLNCKRSVATSAPYFFKDIYYSKDGGYIVFGKLFFSKLVSRGKFELFKRFLNIFENVYLGEYLTNENSIMSIINDNPVDVLLDVRDGIVIKEAGNIKRGVMLSFVFNRNRSGMLDCCSSALGRFLLKSGVNIYFKL